MCWGFLRMRAPGRRSPAALFLVDNKGRSKGLAVQVSLPEGLPPQASDQGLCALPLPRGSAHVHHRGSGEPRAAAQAPVSSQTSSAREAEPRGTRSLAPVGNPAGETYRPHSPCHPSSRRPRGAENLDLSGWRPTES